MDATFDTNDVKYQLFTLMAFNLHYIGCWLLGSSLTEKFGRFNGMVDSIMGKTCSKKVKMETIMFHCHLHHSNKTT
jgi:hypothetical protein